MLAVEGIWKGYGAHHVLAGLSLIVSDSEIVCITGANGCGKTTLLDILSGFVAPDAGTVTLGRRSILGCSPSQISHLGVARTFQRPQIASSLTVGEHAMLFARHHPPLQSKFGRSGVAGDYPLLESLGLARLWSVRSSVLSHGQQKLLNLACAVLTQPKVLLLDEPFAGLSPGVSRTVEQVIRTLQIPKLVVEHNRAIAYRLATRTLYLSGGVLHRTPQQPHRQ